MTEQQEPTRGDEDAPQPSVLDMVSRVAGGMRRVVLQDEPSGELSMPVIKPRGREEVSLPKGRSSYQLMGEIARGGMGAVFKAHDLELGRDMALKVLHEQFSSEPDVLQRFIEEAQIGGQLQHPGIVPVYEMGMMADERPYFTMKLVKGRTLRAMLSERANPADDLRHFVSIFASICQTMAYVHNKGVIHRDLKPANVMVGAFGEVQVVDWGLAKVLRPGGEGDPLAAGLSQVSVIATIRSAADGSDSMAGSVLGTPAYMPPEQAQGNIEELDERSDVFSLGAILAEILTGKPPYPGPRQIALAQAARANQFELEERLEACAADPALVSLTRECLSAARAARPANAGELAELISLHLASAEERAQEAQVAMAAARVQAAEDRRARRLTLTLAVTLILAIVVGAGGWWWSGARAAERSREGMFRVREARNLAAVAAEEGSWEKALAAARDARAQAVAGGFGALLVAEIDVEIEGLEALSAEVQRSDELQKRNQTLMSELRALRQLDEGELTAEHWTALDDTYGGIFFEHGLTPDTGSTLEAADALRALGADLELAAILDEWSGVRTLIGDSPGVDRLLGVARLLDPDATRARIRLARSASDRASARSLAGPEALAAMPAATISLLGDALNWMNAPDEAIEVLRVGLHEYPRDPVLHMAMAWALLDSEPTRPDEARRHLRATLALLPESVEARVTIGYSYRLSDRFTEAIATYRKALAMGGNSATLHNNLGYALSVDGQIAEAGRSYVAALGVDPAHGAARFNLGLLTGRMPIWERPDEMLEFMRSQADRSPMIIFAKGAYVLGLARLGRAEEAREYARQQLSRSDLDPSVRSELLLSSGLTHWIAGEDEEAIPFLERMMATTVGWPGFRKLASGTLAMILASTADAELSDPGRAREMFGPIPRGPGEPEWILEARGVVTYSGGDLGNARKLFEMLLVVGRPDDLWATNRITAHFYLAMIHHREGRTSEARSHYDLALEQAGDHLWIWSEAERLRDQAASVLGLK
ncbi:MAG: protein kinase [Planctomycetota bacterium]